MVNVNLEKKLKTLPNSPGIYFHKSKTGEVLYVGKAAVLKNRVRQYFQATRNTDVKTRALVAEIADVDWLETESEIDALFLESEMVKRYKPRYNVLLRDDKSQMFIRINMQDEFPFVSFTRNPADDGAEYYGPYYNGWTIKKALRYLRRVFPYYTKSPTVKDRSDLDTHIGLNPLPDVSSKEYKASLRQLIRYIKGGRQTIMREIEKQMKQAAKSQDFEQAAKLRNKLNNLNSLRQKIMFGDREFLDISKDVALNDLTELLNLNKIPARIEGYDISHMSGTNVVASMVVFTNGVSDRAEYRKFKISRERNNDFANMNEAITRRFSERNLKSWGVPNLLIIDGGKGQLGAALSALGASQGLTLSQGQTLRQLAVIGLAKREEQIVIKYAKSNTPHDYEITLDKQKLTDLDGYVTITDDFILINLPHNSHVVKLLQRIRDESHRFAVSYHTVLKRRQQTASLLEEIPGIGPITKKKLLRTFGSVIGIRKTPHDKLIATVGKTKADLLRKYLPPV